MSESIGITTVGDTIATLVTSGAAHTKGNWVTLGTATAKFGAVEIHVSDVDTTFNYLIDVRVGGVVAVENFWFISQSSTLFAMSRILIPFSGESGDDIEVRIQCSLTTRTMRLSGLLTSAPFTPANVSSSYGANTSTSSGTTVEADSATANKEGTLVELTSSSGLDEDTDCFVFSVISSDPSVAAETRSVYRIYTGAPGSQTFTGIEWYDLRSTVIDQGTHKYQNVYVDRKGFPAGTRVWMSMQSTTINAGDRAVTVTMHAFQFEQAASPTISQIKTGGEM